MERKVEEFYDELSSQAIYHLAAIENQAILEKARYRPVNEMCCTLLNYRTRQ